jgi:Tol biopolymer transport system component
LARQLEGDAGQGAGRASAPVVPVPYFSEPAIAPDRSEIAFVSGGDIWTAPLAGGEAHLLIAHAAYDSRPRYSPDGKRLAFVSTRTGNGDIYVYTFATGEVRRVTFEDSAEWLDNWSRDGRWLYFSSTSYDIAGMNDVFRVSSDGGTPMPVAGDRYAPEFFAAPGPDGTLAVSARGGQAFGQWWRKGHSHIDESEIWLVKEGAGPKNDPGYQRLSAAGGAKQVWPMWSPDGRTVYYVSDRSRAQNLWSQAATPGSEAKQLTKFRDGRVLWPVISWDGRTVVFERHFAVWKLDTRSGDAAAIPLTRRSAPPSSTPEHLSLTSQIQELALSPDGKKIAFVIRGEVFAANAKDGGNAARVTTTVPIEQNVVWSPDSKQLVYASQRNGDAQLFLYDFPSEKETQLTTATGHGGDASPAFSPDGKSIAFMRDNREVRIYDLAARQERVLSTSNVRRFPAPLVWSPDSKWLAFFSISNKDFRNVYVAPAAGGEARPVTFLSNTFGGSMVWSPDGAYLMFVSTQRTEDGALTRVDLTPRTPKFREDQFRELFQERPAKAPGKAPEGGGGTGSGGAPADKPATKPVEVDFTDIRRRLQILNVGVDVNSAAISPDGKTLLVSANVANQTNYFTRSLDELAREPAVTRQLTSTAEGKSFAQFTPDSKEVYFLGGGRVQVITIESRQSRNINVTAELDVSFDDEKLAVFEQAWSIKRDTFYDPKFHGVDWDAVRAQYAPRIAGARTPDEMRRILNLMVGELNASHTGVGAPGGGGPQGPATGRLGLRFDRAEYESSGRLRITEVIALSPAAVAGVKSGEYLLAVEEKPVGARVALGELLAHSSGKRIEITVAASADGAGKRNVAVMPISIGAEKQLLYRQWVEERRAYVEKASGGRLGYAHMPDMGAGSLAQLYVDLDAENHGREGVVIDIRNNNGGFVNVYAIDVLARRPYLHMTLRGRNAAAPARSTLGQRALELPTVLVVNQHSLSDAEDFTEGYRALKLGKVVGEPTAGWIIYTGGANLLDGSTIRTPQIRITDNAGQNMELHPRPVDVPVTRPVGESYTGKDSQLDAAVAELLKQIGPKKP